MKILVIAAGALLVSSTAWAQAGPFVPPNPPLNVNPTTIPTVVGTSVSQAFESAAGIDSVRTIPLFNANATNQQPGNTADLQHRINVMLLGIQPQP